MSGSVNGSNRIGAHQLSAGQMHRKSSKRKKRRHARDGRDVTRHNRRMAHTQSQLQELLSTQHRPLSREPSLLSSRAPSTGSDLSKQSSALLREDRLETTRPPALPQPETQASKTAPEGKMARQVKPLDPAEIELPSVSEFATGFMANLKAEVTNLAKGLALRACVCLQSPTRSIRAVVSMFLYAGSTAVMASAALGTMAMVLPILGVTTFPFWLAALAIGGAAAAGAGLGLYYASMDRPILPENSNHWMDNISRTLYWSKLRPGQLA